MISEIIIFSVVNVIGFFTQFLPGAGEIPLKLPWGIDDIFVQAVTAFKTLAAAFPPFNTILTAFIIYISFRVIVKIIKVIPFVGNTIDA